MPARRGRPKKGDRRIDAAIDHFVAMGYAARDVRAVVADLLKVYGGPDAWPLLEEASYEVVQNKLFEKEDEEKQKQDQPLLQQQQQDDQQVEDQPPQHQEPAADEVPRDNISILGVHNEVPAETESADEEVDSMFIEPPPLEAVVPLNADIRTGHTRRPCYGWLSESEDEEQPTGQPHDMHVPSPGGGLFCKRMRVE